MKDAGPKRDNDREQAVKYAMAKAELFAEAAWVRVGRVISIYDTAEPLVEGPRVIAEPMLMEEAQGKAVPVAVGEATVRAEVTMVFEILQ
jgi:uncharacterized protein YggE